MALGPTPALVAAGALNAAHLAPLHLLTHRQLQDYWGQMPWLALPYDQQAAGQRLSSRFGVMGIPRLVIVGADGQVRRPRSPTCTLKESQARMLASAAQNWCLVPAHLPCSAHGPHPRFCASPAPIPCKQAGGGQRRAVSGDGRPLRRAVSLDRRRGAHLPARVCYTASAGAPACRLLRPPAPQALADLSAPLGVPHPSACPRPPHRPPCAGCCRRAACSCSSSCCTG